MRKPARHRKRPAARSDRVPNQRRHHGLRDDGSMIAPGRSFTAEDAEGAEEKRREERYKGSSFWPSCLFFSSSAPSASSAVNLLCQPCVGVSLAFFFLL